MTDAINIFLYFWNKTITFFFNNLVIVKFNNVDVSVGWVIVTIIVMIAIINLIIALPKGNSTGRSESNG